MIDRTEIVRSLVGSWRLLAAKPDALRYFDPSEDGFWRSFQAILLVAPIYAVTVLANRGGAVADVSVHTSDGLFWAAKILTVAVDWVTLPILLAAIAGPIGIKRAYPVYVVVRNWSMAVVILPFAVLAVLDSIGIVTGDLLDVASVAALAFALTFGYVIARRTLNVGIDVAVGIVILDFLVSFAVALIIGRLMGVEAFD